MKNILLLILIFGIFTEYSCSVKIDVSKTTTTTTTQTNNESTSTTTTTTIAPTTTPTTISPSKKTTTTLNATTTVLPTTTTTPKPNLTDTTTINETKVDELTKNTILQIPNYYCKCDLKLKVCDINCCCDIYCSSEIIKLFDCSKENFDLNDYEQNSALPSCKVDGGLLCVMEDDRKASNEFFDINLETSVNYKWPSAFAVEETKEYSDMYRFDDPILVFNENTEMVETLDLPYSLTESSKCEITTPTTYLQDYKTECLKSMEQLQLFNTELLEKLSTTHLLKSPKNNKNEMIENCSEDCLETKIYACEDLLHCLLQTNSSEPVNFEEFICSKILLNFRHNFTDLLGLEVYFFRSSNEENFFLLSIEVNFLLVNETKGDNEISGNLGYLKKNPLIVSRMVYFNKTDLNNREMIFEYFNLNRTLKNLKIPNKNCLVENSTESETINFGENIWFQCNKKLNFNITKESNFTEVCLKFQEKIFFDLINGIEPSENITNFSKLNLFISEFGNPKNISENWIELEMRNKFDEKITGAVDDESFTCKNMILNVEYEFYYARLRIGSVKNQFVLKKAFLKFGTRVDLRFNLNEEMKVPLFLNVLWMDLTSSSFSSKISESLFLVFSMVLINLSQ